MLIHLKVVGIENKTALADRTEEFQSVRSARTKGFTFMSHPVD